MQHHLSTPSGAAVGGSFSDDPELDAELEALVRENEQMLIEITELHARSNASQKKIADLEETCERLREEKRSLQDLYDGSRSRNHNEDDDDQDWQAKYEELFEQYEELVHSQVEENRAYEPHGSADSKERIDRILKELRTFHSSQQMSFGYLKRCGVIPSTLRDKVPLECQKSLQTLTKLIETSRRLTTASADDDEMIVLVKGLVGEATLAGSLALQDTLSTFAEFLGISSAGSGAASGGSAAGQETGGASKMLNFWKGK
ncbi:Hypothetical protein, putative [Bodo saltans]|uniref:Uncharacterized protein n=1 Tax=Bodo saltans TaxID=75058 RepID=A0A0S4JSI7_BODSA|nr:Hypothetical protein, putative [Bodo saltans]|eukprot:CUG93203.1 Hypothetical protein, putative [Bodo saltans]